MKGIREQMFETALKIGPSFCFIPSFSYSTPYNFSMTSSMKHAQLISAIESMLFTQGEPLEISRLVAVLDASEEEILQGLEAMIKRYALPESGLSLVIKDESVQLVTKAQNTPILEDFFKSTMQESLSKAAMEVLSVIAYRGPVSRSEIEAIRGVNCSVTLRNLLMRELIERVENEHDAREYLYTVSFTFLRELGLQKLSDLPEFETLSRDARISTVITDTQTL